MGESFKTDFGEVHVTATESKVKKFAKTAWEWIDDHKTEIGSVIGASVGAWLIWRMGRSYQSSMDLSYLLDNRTTVTVVDNECGNVIHASIPNDEIADINNFQLLIKRFPDVTPDVNITNF